MMVGFTGALSPAVVDDWRQHQFGGLIVVPVNQNAQDPEAIRRLIQSVRGVMAHPLLVATNQEGGTVCFPETQVPCMAGARQAGARRRVRRRRQPLFRYGRQYHEQPRFPLLG